MPIWVTKQCFRCTRWLQGSDPPACAAFNGPIPARILSGQHDHTQPYEGDNGLLFEPKLRMLR